MADVLFRADADALGRQVGIALQQLLRRAAKTHVRGRIDAVSEVQANRANRRTIADTKACGMNGVVEVLKIFLAEAERNVADAAEDVSHVMEEDPLYVGCDEWEAQLDIVEEQRVAAEWETGRLR